MDVKYPQMTPFIHIHCFKCVFRDTDLSTYNELSYVHTVFFFIFSRYLQPIQTIQNPFPVLSGDDEKFPLESNEKAAPPFNLG